MRKSTFTKLASTIGCVTALVATTAGGAAAASGGTVDRQIRTTATADHVNSVISDMGPAGGVFSAGTAWKTDITNAPLHTNNAAMSANIAEQSARYYGGIAAFNVKQYNTSIYTVDSTQPTVNVNWWNCQKKTYTPTGLIGPGGQFTSVPIPADAVPAKGTDAQLTVYSPSTDQLWEFWRTSKVNGQWQACWGGRIDNVSQSQGYFENGFGASASGLSVTGGTITIKDIQSGSIEHAMALAIPDVGYWKTFSWPAQRSDGNDQAADALLTGTRLRLDPAIDVESLKLTPIAKMIAKAAQKYGFIVTDKSGCVAVSAESSAAVKADTGIDPWVTLMKGKPDYLIMQNFPWDKMQALPKDYGKPVVTATPTASKTTATKVTSTKK